MTPRKVSKKSASATSLSGFRWIRKGTGPQLNANQ
jgi:hypothetical protein